MSPINPLNAPNYGNYSQNLSEGTRNTNVLSELNAKCKFILISCSNQYRYKLIEHIQACVCILSAPFDQTTTFNLVLI